MPCQWIKERKYLHFVYYRGTFWIKCVFWPWFQVCFLRRRIFRWKILPPEMIVLDPDKEIIIATEEQKNQKRVEEITRHFTPEMKEIAKEIIASKGILQTKDVINILCKNPEVGREVIDEANSPRGA